MIESTEFKTFLSKAQEIVNLNKCEVFSYVLEYTVLEKWVRVDKLYFYKETGLRQNSRSVYCFVARESFSNKTLGNVNVGGIHKPASFKAPAKHERGNIFGEYEMCLTPHGIKYLR